MTLKTNYAGHDIAYEKKLSSGQDGWDHKSEYAQFAHRMSSVMQRVDTNGLVLELGCGAGNMSQWLKTIGYSDIVGVGISKAAIDHARLRLPDDQFYCLDLTQQPLNALSNSFDAVFDSHMLHCIALLAMTVRLCFRRHVVYLNRVVCFLVRPCVRRLTKLLQSKSVTKPIRAYVLHPVAPSRDILDLLKIC